MPQSHAEVDVIRGEMGGGKTNTLVGFIVDKYYSQLYAIKSPRGTEYPCKPYGDYKDRVTLLEKGQKPRVVLLPDVWIPLSTLKVFTNFHLFGIQHVFCTVHDMFKWLNNKIIMDGILGIDEAYIQLEARRGSSASNVTLTQFMQQMRKRHIHLYILSQNNRFIDWRARWLHTREITCRYDGAKIHLTIKNMRRNKQKSITYDGSQYWRYFDTDEIPEMPEKMIERVLSKMG